MLFCLALAGGAAVTWQATACREVEVATPEVSATLDEGPRLRLR